MSAMPMLLARLWIAEVMKLLSRPLARVGWVVLGGLGLAVVLVVNVVGGAALEVNGQPTSLAASPADGVLFALVVRNFYVSQVLVLVLAATSMAGEYQLRTLREDLLRPVPRWVVLMAKWAALVTWSSAALVIQWVVTVVAAFLFLSAESDTLWSDVFGGYVIAVASDASFAAAALMVAVLTRSLTSTIAATFLFLVFEGGLWAVLWIGQSLRGTEIPSWLEAILDALPFLPSSAWSLATQVGTGNVPPTASIVSLVLITVVSLVVAERVFDRVDVP